MYCYHCGYQIDERKIEKKESTLEKNKSSLQEGTSVSYVCPRCGHLIHEGHDEVDMKSLSAASHAEIQRGRNFFASGMGANCLGAITLILAIVFFALSFKPGLQHQLVTTCPEFSVSMVLFAATLGLLSFGITYTVKGLSKIRKYNALLKDINHQTFVQ